MEIRADSSGNIVAVECVVLPPESAVVGDRALVTAASVVVPSDPVEIAVAVEAIAASAPVINSSFGTLVGKSSWYLKIKTNFILLTLVMLLYMLYNIYVTYYTYMLTINTKSCYVINNCHPHPSNVFSGADIFLQICGF